MARLVTTVQKFTGTTAQRLALVTTSINPGSTFFDEDEGVIYSLSRATPRVWVPKQTRVASITDTGSRAEEASAQETEVATSVETYNRAAGASQIEVYVESGSVRVRTDGAAATDTTGEPIGAGYMNAWSVASISVYYVENSTITVVSR